MTNRGDDDFAYAGPSRSGVFWAAGLVLAALLIGVVVLQAIDDDPSGAGGTTTVAGESVPTESTLVQSDPFATTTTLAVRLPNAVRVIVTNGSGVNKAARRVNDQLVPLGYTMVSPRDANASNKADAVFFKPGFEPEATAIAASLGVTTVLGVPTAEQTIKTPPAIPEFDVQVMVGPILAQKFLPGGTATTAPAATTVAPAAPAA